VTGDPWTSDDPQPGDFDALLEDLSETDVVVREGDPEAHVRILVSVEGEDARRLQRISEARGQSPHDLVAELLRDADRPAA
jgi:hypothetical protein